MRGPPHWLILITLLAAWSPARAATAIGPTSRAASQPTAVQEFDPAIESVDFRATTLEKAFDTLREMTKLNIVVRWRELEAAGIDRKAPLDLRVTNLPLLRLIELIGECSADHVPLAARADRGVVIVSTRESLESESTLRLYEVRELIEADIAVRLRMAISQSATMPTTNPTNEEAYSQSLEQLQHVIMETIDPDSWRANGGTVGSMDDFNGQLIVAQTPAAHERIRKLLEELRRK